MAGRQGTILLRDILLRGVRIGCAAQRANHGRARSRGHSTLARSTYRHHQY
jgi:hypothetical protein